MAAVDPGALQVMSLSSDLLREQDRVKHLRRQLLAMLCVLRLEQQRSAALCDLVDALLDGDG